MIPLIITTVAIIIIFLFVLCIRKFKEEESFFQEIEEALFQEMENENKINNILENCKEDSVVIDGVKYIKVPKPTHFWKKIE